MCTVGASSASAVPTAAARPAAHGCSVPPVAILRRTVDSDRSPARQSLWVCQCRAELAYVKTGMQVYRNDAGNFAYGKVLRSRRQRWPLRSLASTLPGVLLVSALHQGW